ncbi:BlaI/MecI/CopY family transcriptional regulator [Streptomyces sp. NPDC001797]|uniref:BlaI/MecI/CopY family transcriptional regulator n=1 Tax=Streptomyces sp. 900105755 TaxID=3154389 RepID=A0ABV1TJN3_9ACTN
MASLLAARRSGRRRDAADTHGRGPKRANGARETELLGLLHKAGTALTPGEVAERLGGELTYGSIVTILTRMHTKGLLTRIPRGRAYACAPVTDDVGTHRTGRTSCPAGQSADAWANGSRKWSGRRSGRHSHGNAGRSWKLRDCPPDKHVRVQEARRRWLPRTVGAVSAGRSSVEPSTG